MGGPDVRGKSEVGLGAGLRTWEVAEGGQRDEDGFQEQ